MTETPSLQLLAFAAEPGGGNPARSGPGCHGPRRRADAAHRGRPGPPRDGLRGSPRRPSRGGALLLARGRGPLLRARHHRHGGRARRGGGHRPLHVRHRGRRRRGLDRPRRRGARPCRVHQRRAVHDRPRTRRRRPTPRHPGSSPRRSRRADAARPDLRRQPAPGGRDRVARGVRRLHVRPRTAAGAHGRARMEGNRHHRARRGRPRRRPRRGGPQPLPVGGDITEDPATGSAAGSLGAYLRERIGVPAPFAFTVRQGRHIGRPSVLEVEVPASGGIRVSGTAVPLEG